MGTIFNLCVLLCLVALLGHRRTDRDLLGNSTSNHPIINYQASNDQIPSRQNAETTQRLLEIAKSQIGVREASGNNDGKQVESYLKYTGNRKGEPWCAAFVSWVFGQTGLKEPRTAWSPSLFPKSKLSAYANPAVIFGVYYTEKRRIAHVGIVEKQKGSWVYAMEGNTNLAGSREGDGVYRKLRHIRTIHSYASWLPEEGGVK